MPCKLFQRHCKRPVQFDYTSPGLIVMGSGFSANSYAAAHQEEEVVEEDETHSCTCYGADSQMNFRQYVTLACTYLAPF